MLSAMLLVAALGTNPVAAALERFDAVDSYRATLHTWSDDGRQVVRFYYRKPGFVRMEFVEPHAGAVLVYSPLTGRVKLWPFGLGSFPELDLSPGNRLIRGPRGHTVDRSDIGELLRKAQQLQRSGSQEVVGEEAVGERPAWRVAVTGAPGASVDGVHRYDLWLAGDGLFPLKAESRDERQRLLESTTMEDVQLGVRFPDHFFDP